MKTPLSPRRLAFAVAIFVACLAIDGPCRTRAAESESKPPVFEVGFGERDITPPAGLPMWGYGARHAMLSQGGPRSALRQGGRHSGRRSKLAIVGTDLGRGPTQAMMAKIRR